MKKLWPALLAITMLVCVGLADDATPGIFNPNENLIAQGVPPVPENIVERANRYTEFRAAMIFAWHPQHREMLVGTRFAETVQIHRVTMPGGARTQLTFYPDPAELSWNCVA